MGAGQIIAMSGQKPWQDPALDFAETDIISLCGE
jgi:hypothetical protein